MAGSSPLARGLLSHRTPHKWCARIIPARAGFTFPQSRLRRQLWDHPRSRGVYAERIRKTKFGTWIIPARAGFTPPAPTPARRSRDHPRSRGVYRRNWYPVGVAPGSSPLARGLRPAAHAIGLAGRIIPARAGFTRRRIRRTAGYGDHPRSRGVYARKIHRIATGRGSSPLARGLRRADRGNREGYRIIPARAGFTIVCPPLSPLAEDHPRSRGVYQANRALDAAPLGSSPLARGLRSCS